MHSTKVLKKPGYMPGLYVSISLELFVFNSKWNQKSYLNGDGFARAAAYFEPSRYIYFISTSECLCSEVELELQIFWKKN